MNPFFSIIIPTYNRAHLIEVAVKSVLGQSFQSWELIIIDDGSTDGTGALLEKYRSDARIRYVFQKNQERSRSRNNGIALATGDFVCFLDSDDYYLPDHLSVLKCAIDTHPLTCAFLVRAAIECNGERMFPPVICHKEHNSVEFVFVNSFTAQSACIKRELLDTHRFDPALRIGEDRELWVRIAETCPFEYIDASTVVICEHGGRSVGIANEWACREGYATIKKICSEHRNSISATLRKQACSKEHFYLGRHFQYKGRNGKAMVQYIAALPNAEAARRKELLYLIFSNFKMIFSKKRK